MIAIIRLFRSTRSSSRDNKLVEVYASPVHPALIISGSTASIETVASSNASIKSFSSVERVPPTYDEAAAQALADERMARVLRTDRAIGDACKAYGF